MPSTPHATMQNNIQEQSRPPTSFRSHPSSVDTVRCSPVPHLEFTPPPRSLTLQLRGQLIHQCEEIHQSLTRLHQDYHNHQNYHAHLSGPMRDCCFYDICEDLQYRREKRIDRLVHQGEKHYAKLRFIHFIRQWETEKEREWIRGGLIGDGGLDHFILKNSGETLQEMSGGGLRNIFKKPPSVSRQKTEEENWAEAARDWRAVVSQPTINYRQLENLTLGMRVQTSISH